VISPDWRGGGICWPGCWPAGSAGGGWNRRGRGKPAYRCRHGHTSAAAPNPGRPKNAYVREERILPRLPALHLLLTGTDPAGGRRRRTRRGVDVRRQCSAEDVIAFLREREITLTYDPAAGTLRAGTASTAQIVTMEAS
jgi:site-specific DNA recombinase